MTLFRHKDDPESQRVVLDVRPAVFVKIFFFLLLLVAVYFLRQIIGLIFASLVLALAFDPWVDWLQRHKIPRTIGILIIYFVLFVVFGLSIVLLIPPVIQQASDIAANFPEYYDRAIGAINALDLPADLNLKEQLAAQIGKLSSLAAGAASGILSSVLNFFGSVSLILILTLYFIIAEENLKGFVRRITPAQHKVYVIDLIERMQRQLGLWLQGQIILSVVIFILTFIGLLIIGVKNALLLAFLAGVLEIIPFLGPILAAIPGIFFALSQSFTHALLALVVYVIVQQGESNLLLPRVMSKSVDLNPVVVFLAVLIGAKLGGVMGALLAVPVAAAGSIVVNDWINRRTAGSAEP